MVGSDSRKLVQWLVRMSEGWFGCSRVDSDVRVVGSDSRGLVQCLVWMAEWLVRLAVCLVRMAEGGLGWPKCSGSGSREVVQWLVWMAVWFCALHVFLLM